MMDETQAGSSRSRRRFLSRGATLLAGGIVGGAAYGSVAAANQPAPGAAPALPWAWRPIDPMEAGSRAYRIYHDVGG
jgi:hypothetical protein